jgi:flagellin-like protein
LTKKISNVRNITKFKRSIKAISPVIATLLMIAIAVVASLVVYAWVSGYIGFQTGNTGKAIQIQSYAPGADANHMLVYVQNVGQQSVDIPANGGVYINDVGKTTPSSVNILAGETETLNVDLGTDTWVAGQKVTIKVVTASGTFSQVVGTGTSASGADGSSGATATKLVFASGASQSLTVNVVSGAIVVERQDASSNPVSTGAPAVLVDLSTNGAGIFYLDSAGTTSITQITIAAESSSATFYYKPTAVGTGTHTLTAAYSGLTSATSDFAVSATDYVFTEDFETSITPTWTTSGTVTRSNSYPSHDGYYASLAGTSGGTDAAITTGISSAGYSSGEITFWGRVGSTSYTHYLYIQWSVGSGWNTISSGTASSTSWRQYTVTLPSGALNSANLQIRFQSDIASGNHAYVDDVVVTLSP